MRFIEILQDIQAGKTLIRAGASFWVENEDYGRWVLLHGQKVCDLTPNPVMHIYGHEREHQMSRFWTDLCPCRRANNGVRLTRCAMCNDTGRVIVV